MLDKKILYCIILLVGLVLPLSAQAKLQYIVVEEQGTGATIKEAIYDGIVLAISRVNGQKVASKTKLSVKEETSSTDDGSSYAASSSFAQETISATKGVVKEFDVLDKHLDESLGGLWVVKLKVTVAKYKVSKQANRLRLAVMPFKTHGAKGKVKDISDFSILIGQSLASFLTQTRKFAVLDRDFTSEQNTELNSVSDGDRPVEELARLGNKLSADYMVVGKIHSIVGTPRLTVMRSTGKEFKKLERHVSLSFLIIDVATGQIKFSDQYNKTDTVNGGNFDLSNLANKVIYQIGNKVLNSIYPIRVESVNNKVIYLGQGGSSLKKGQKLKLIKLGKKIVDSYTKESLGREEIDIGLVEIIDVQAKQSKAKISKSQVDLAKDFRVKGFLVRPIYQASKGSRKQSVKKVTKSIEKKFKKLKSEASDDW